jgi:hypothetical protein
MRLIKDHKISFLAQEINEAVSAEQRKKLMGDLKVYCDDTGADFDEVCKVLGFSSSKMKGLTSEQIGWLRTKYGEKWEYNPETGKVDLEGYCSVYSDKSESIPHKIQFGVCKGDFRWTNGNLTSLKGFPATVTGDLDIANNSIVSLEFCTKEVGGSFNCNGNKITSLEDGPEKVKDNYNCGRNNLKSLKGAPSKINRFYCEANYELESLIGGPEDVYSYDCSDCNLDSLKGIAQTIKSSVNVSKNKLWTLEGLDPEFRGNVSASKNYYPESMLKDMLRNANRYGSWIGAYLVLLTNTKHQRMSKDERDKLRNKLTKQYISDNAIGLAKIWKDPIMDNPAIKRLFKKTEAGKEEEFVRSADLGADLSDLGF